MSFIRLTVTLIIPPKNNSSNTKGQNQPVPFAASAPTLFTIVFNIFGAFLCVAVRIFLYSPSYKSLFVDGKSIKQTGHVFMIGPVLSFGFGE